MDVGLLPFAARSVILVWGEVDDGLCVTMICACHDGDMCRTRCRAIGNPQRQVICLRAGVDKVGNLRAHHGPFSHTLHCIECPPLLCIHWSCLCVKPELRKAARGCRYARIKMVRIKMVAETARAYERGLTDSGSGKVDVSSSAYVQRPS